MSRTPKTDALVAALRRRGVEVLEHADWDSVRRDVYRARLDSRPHALLPGRPVDTLWNHITVTFDDGELVGDFKADMREVERIGYERFGSGVSYNILVDANADRPRVAIGQFLEAKGTHTVNDKGIRGYSRDQNAVALAVAWVGVPGDRLNEHALTAMVEVRGALIEVDALTPGYDDNPHSLVAWKDCPTGELRDRLPDLKTRATRAITPKGLVMDREVKAAFDALNEKVDAMAADVARSKQFLAYSRKRELLTNKRLKSLGITAEQIQAVLDEAETGGSGEA